MTATSGWPEDGSPLVVGFDLDMTLINSAPGIAEVYRALSAETGVYIDADLVASRLGPPLEREMANWFPAADIDAACDRYRALYPGIAVPLTELLPGAAEAFDTVRALGGVTVVITSKHEGNARLCLDQCGLESDYLVGWAFGDGKRDALLRHGAQVYVGDHIADMKSARAAADVTGVTESVMAVGVTTGPHDAAELTAAGANIVLPDLRGFPSWLTTYAASLADETIG